MKLIKYKDMLTQVYNNKEPNLDEEAKGHPRWVVAMEEEMNAVIKNKTWDIVNLLKNKIKCNCKGI